MVKQAVYIVASLMAAAFVLSGCSSSNGDAQVAALSEVSIREAVQEPDPQGAAEAVLATLKDRSYEQLDSGELEQYIGISASDTEDFVAFYSDATSGLCDIVFIKPAKGKRDHLREALFTYKEARKSEFENYDILDSSRIAENAVVLDQGDYLVLLMLPDNEAAQDIIDEYLPL